MSTGQEGSGRGHLGLVAFALAVLLGVIGAPAVYWLWRKYDPYVLSRADNQEVKLLSDVSRQRPLTPVEFDRTLKLLESNEAIAQLMAIAVLQAEAGRDPSRKEAVLAGLAKCQQAANADVARSAGLTAARMKNPPRDPADPMNPAAELPPAPRP